MIIIIIEGKFKNNYYISPILRGIFFHVLTTLKSECILHIAIWSVFLLAAHTRKLCLGVNVTTDYGTIQILKMERGV